MVARRPDRAGALRRLHGWCASGAVLCAVLAACSSGGGGGGKSAGELAGELAALPTPGGLTIHPQPATDGPDPSATPTPTPTPTRDASGAAPITTTVVITTYRMSATYDTQVLLNPASNVIYPGSVLVGSSIADGSYQEIIRGEKNDIVVSYGGLNGVLDASGNPGVVSGTIRPTLDAFRAFHNQVMTQDLSHGVSTTYTLETMDASTQRSFDVHIGAGLTYKAPAVTASIRGHFDYDDTHVTNKFMIRFAQTFYTVDVDQGAAGFLYKSFDLADFQGTRPVYVSSVAFGRLAFVTLETSEDRETIEGGFDLLVESLTTGADVGADARVKALETAANLNVTVIGSSQVLTGIKQLTAFLKDGGFSAQNLGQIVAYKLRFVDDNSVANTIYSDSYPIRKVIQTTGAWKVTVNPTGIMFTADDNGGGDLQGELVVQNDGWDWTLWQNAAAGGVAYPDKATTWTDISATILPVFQVPSTDTTLRFVSRDVLNYNAGGGSNDIAYSVDTSPTLGVLLAEMAAHGYVTIEASRTDSSGIQDHVRWRVIVTVEPVY